MTASERPVTAQERFWAGDFGNEYSARNAGQQLLASNLRFFTEALHSADRIGSCIEFGANIGMNLRALRLLYPNLEPWAVEINATAAAELREVIGDERVSCASIFDHDVARQVDLSLIKGVLIHLNPDHLQDAYVKLYEASRRYVLICEYYNPTPTAIPYRGHEGRLFKRDFAGEMLDAFPDLGLIDYGFAYHRDRAFPQDDITWFLLEKGAR